MKAMNFLPLLLLFSCVGNAASTDSPEPEPEVKGILVATPPVCISRITGDNSSTERAYLNPRFPLDNQTPEKYDIGGCDLGIPWQISEGKFGLFFGDTFGKDFRPAPNGGGNGSNWRGNVLLYSDDTDLSDGITIKSAAMNSSLKYAREICFSAHDVSGSGDYTSIPTSVVHANGCEYVHYFNIRTWNGWTTNHSKVYKSIDGGKEWTIVKTLYFGGESHFGQVGYFNNASRDGYVYMVGTQTGRSDNAQVARFKEEDIEDQSKYEYWNGTQWIEGDETAAIPIVHDKVGELSVAYADALGKWVMLYINEPRCEITLRYADQITGPWSSAKKFIDNQGNMLYGSFIHPLSFKDGKTMYFTVSSWIPYNVYLMSSVLKLK